MGETGTRVLSKSKKISWGFGQIRFHFMERVSFWTEIWRWDWSKVLNWERMTYEL